MGTFVSFNYSYTEFLQIFIRPYMNILYKISFLYTLSIICCATFCRKVFYIYFLLIRTFNKQKNRYKKPVGRIFTISFNIGVGKKYCKKFYENLSFCIKISDKKYIFFMFWIFKFWNFKIILDTIFDFHPNIYIK